MMNILFLYFSVAMLAALAVILVGISQMFRCATRRYGGRCVVVGAVAFLASAGATGLIMDAEAWARGFSSSRDEREALGAGFSNAKAWHAKEAIALAKAVEVRAKRDRALIEQLEKAEHDKTLALEGQFKASARLRNEQARVAAESAKIEKSREAAEQERAALARSAADSAKVRQAEQIAENARIEQASNVAAEKAMEANAEKARAADADAAVRRYKDLQDQYSQSAARSILMFHAALKDPSSAAVREIRTNQLPGGRSALCGLVNAKNSLGAFTGYQRFVAIADLNVIAFERGEDSGVFASSWNNYCFE